MDKFFQKNVKSQNEVIKIILNNTDTIDKTKPKLSQINQRFLKTAKLVEEFGLDFEFIEKLLREYGLNFEDARSILKECKSVTTGMSETVKTLAQVDVITLIGLRRSNEIYNNIYSKFMDSLKKLSYFNPSDTGKIYKELNAILVYKIANPSSPTTIQPENIDFFVGKDLSLYSQGEIRNILSANGVDIKANKKILNDILKNDKEKILRELSLKCQNTVPDFVNKIEELLESEGKCSRFLTLPNLSTETIIKELYEVARLATYVYSKPQDYINGEVSPNVAKAIREKNLVNEPKTGIELRIEDIEELDSAMSTIAASIDKRLLVILNGVMSSDTEMIKLLLDKRFNSFSEELRQVITLPKHKKLILNDLIRNGQQINKKGEPAKLSGAQKLRLLEVIKASNYIEENGGTKIDFEKHKTQLNNGKFLYDINGLEKELLNEILMLYGFSSKEIAELKPENLNWDLSRIATLFKTPVNDKGELKTLIQEACKGNFENFINSPDNAYGRANIETERIFSQKGLDFKAWENGAPEKEITINGTTYKIKLWNRIPQESLFDGSYTTCCTKLEGPHGSAIANYLLSKAVNVVEIKDSKGKVVAMSRVCIADVDGKTTFIIENIEANNALIKTLKAEDTVEDFIFAIHKYQKEYATLVGGKELPVLMSTSYNKFKDFELKDYYNVIEKETQILGGFVKDEIYFNTFKAEVSPDTREQAEFYVLRK